MAIIESSAKVAAVSAAFLGDLLIGDYRVVYHRRVPTTGISSASLSVSLAKNTLVRQFDVVVEAGRAQQTEVEKVAQVRAYSTSGDNHVIIDFGVPRTVSAISIVPAGAQITSVSAWTGAAFGKPFYTNSGTSHAVFDSEVRSERLLVVLSAAIPDPLGRNVIVELPDPPSDLEIRINGGAPVWSNPGPVEPSADDALTKNGWNKEAKRIVPLADALNALLADPMSDASAAYELTLTTKVPGVLTIVERARSLSFINRVSFNDDTSKALDFAEEGVVTLPLTLPPIATKRSIEEIRLVALGNLPPERVLPAVGPPAATALDGSLLADLMLDPQRAACVRLSDQSNLVELTAIRLPLATDADGAEASVVLWEDDGGAPSKPLANGASKPATLTAAPAVTEAWTRFAFAKPVAIDAGKPPWVAVLVSRGTVTWPLSSTSAVKAPATPDDALGAANELLRGAPNGPWNDLPLPLQSGFMEARGRVRIAGNAAKSAPVDPLLIGAFGSWNDVTPTVKGVPVTITSSAAIRVAGNSAPPLFVVSRTAGAVTLRDVDVVWSPVDESALPATQLPTASQSA